MRVTTCLIYLICSTSLLSSIAGCRDPISDAKANKQFKDAIRSENVNAVGELIESGANVNARGWEPGGDAFATKEFTPLHYAAVGSNAEIVRLLLDAGANVHAKTHTLASTPILVARRADIIRLLAEAGANANATDAAGRTALFAVLMDSLQPDAVPFDPGESIQALIDAGADAFEGGFTPLHWAAATGNLQEIRRLVAAGADIHAADVRAKLTPLHVAALCGQRAAIRALAKAGADLERLNEYKLDFYPAPGGPARWTALHLAARAGMTESVKALIDAGANVNARGTDGYVDVNATPLHFAASALQVDNRTQADAIKMLLDAGADPFAKVDAGRTPLDCATILEPVTEDDRAVVDILQKAMKQSR